MRSKDSEVKDRKGLIIVISAPSGSGKTTLCKRLVAKVPNLRRSISVTTRNPRRDEINGRDYFFITQEDFVARKRNNEFIEWATVFDEYYGTPRSFVEEVVRAGEDVLLSIDVQGAMQVKESYPDAVFIFILPPSISALEERLRKRKTDDSDEILKRLQLAREEMKRIENYDYVIVNRSLKASLRELLSIITAEKRKVERSKDEIDDLRSF